MLKDVDAFSVHLHLLINDARSQRGSHWAHPDRGADAGAIAGVECSSRSGPLHCVQVDGMRLKWSERATLCCRAAR